LGFIVPNVTRCVPLMELLKRIHHEELEDREVELDFCEAVSFSESFFVLFEFFVVNQMRRKGAWIAIPARRETPQIIGVAKIHC
jgi:hypothetical protein